MSHSGIPSSGFFAQLLYHLKMFVRFIIRTKESASQVRNFLNSQLLAILIIVFLLGFIFVDIIKTSSEPAYIIPWYGYVFLGTSFLVNRYVSYRLAAIITNFMFPLVLFTQLLTNPNPNAIHSLFFLVLGIILASLFLKRLEFIIYSILIIIFLCSITFFGMIPDDLLDDMVNPVVSCFFAVILSQLLHFQLKAIENRRLMKLEASEKRFRDLVESTSDWIWEIDDKGRIVYSSPQLKNILGYDVHEILGKTPFFFMSNDQSMQSKQIFNEHKEKGFSISRFRCVCFHKNGHEIVIETSGIPIFDSENRLTGYRGVNRDISEKSRIESKLLESETRYGMFINNFQGIIYGIDLLDNHLVFFDGAVESISFYKRSRFLSGEINWNDLIHPDDRSVIFEKEEKLFQNQDFSANYEYRIILPDSSVRWIKDICSIGDDPVTHRKILQGVLLDISESKFFYEKMRQSEKLEAIGQLAGGVAHDFNNQLAGIVGYADILRLNLQDNQELKELTESILLSAHRATDLTTQLMAYARKGKFQSVKVNIHHVIKEVCHLLNHTIDKRIIISQFFNAQHDEIMGDPTQIQNAFLNISLNARDAMAEGGDLVFRTENIRLENSYCLKSPFEIIEGEYIKISISDTGVGMPGETQSRVFEPFFTTKERGKGTGMGLSAVYGTVKSHKGAIEVTSELGIGSCFVIYLPNMVAGAHEPKKNILPPVRNTFKKYNILVVDDEPNVLRMLSRMLESLGHNTYMAIDGFEALDIYQKYKDELDFVILDIIMPKFDGKQTFRSLLQIDPCVKVILCSGFSINEEAQLLLEEGALGFIKKPFNLDAIQNKISEVLLGK